MWTLLEVSAQQKVAPYSRHQNHFAGPELLLLLDPPFGESWLGGDTCFTKSARNFNLHMHESTSELGLICLIDLPDPHSCGYNRLNVSESVEDNYVCVPRNYPTCSYVTAVSPVKRG